MPIGYYPAIIILYLKKKPKRKKIDYSLLTEREAIIIKLLKKSKSRISQKRLEKELTNLQPDVEEYERIKNKISDLKGKRENKKRFYEEYE